MKSLNIFTHLNGVGLQSDYELLKSVITDYNVMVIDLHQHHVPKSDVAIHLEVPRFEHMASAKRNIFIPNPEWFYPEWSNRTLRFDEVWCKTKDCYDIFKNHIHRNCKLSGFFSKDLFMPDVKKQKVLIHVAGKSSAKNTATLIKAYNQFPDLPRCFLVSSVVYIAPDNLISTGRLNDSDFKTMLNACLIHVCPSSYEGFGHYLHEAMGCGSVVITTDHAPMNEILTDSDYLVKCTPVKKRMRLAIPCEITPESLYESIMSVWNKSNTELLETGKNNRLLFDSEVNNFKEFVKCNI